jgi:hypothetical protein
VNDMPDVETASRQVAIQPDQSISAPAQEGAGALLSAIVALAKDPSIDVAKLSALMQMQERMEARDAERQFNEAMHRVQARLKPMIKMGKVDLGKGSSYSYLRREDLDDQLRPIASEEGFSWSFTQKPAASGGMTVYIHVRHVAGHTQTSEMELPPDGGPGRSPLQARVSTISFCERILTEMVFNVVRKGADDNGMLGGKRFVTPEQAEELRTMCQAARRQEESILDRLFSGKIKSFEEVETAAFVVVKNALDSIISQQTKKGQL